MPPGQEEGPAAAQAVLEGPVALVLEEPAVECLDTVPGLPLALARICLDQ